MTLLTRDGLLVDEIETCQIEAGYSQTLRDLCRQARAAAFNLPRMAEEMLPIWRRAGRANCPKTCSKLMTT